MKMKSSNILGLRGWTHIASIALEAGCKPIPCPNELDTGIDGFVELVRDEIPSGAFLAIQAKMGISYFRDGRPRVQADKDHFEYWSNFSMPVILVVVAEDQSKTYWMDVKEYLSQNKNLIKNGPDVLWPSPVNLFTAETLCSYALPHRVKPLDFLSIVNGIATNDSQGRLAALSQLYTLRQEAATPYVLVAQLEQEREQQSIQVICDFLSRYLAHPEMGFGLHCTPAPRVASQILSGLSFDCLIRILENVEDDNYSYDGAPEIWKISHEEVWPRCEMFARGSLQQSMAVVVRACADDEKLKKIIADVTLSLSARKNALAMFGYHGHSCMVDFLDSVAATTSDEVFRALLEWMRFIILEESGAFDEDEDDDSPTDEA